MTFSEDQIINGDAYDLIRHIPDRAVNLVITSPPYYQQRDYGGGIGTESSVEEYVRRLTDIFAECVRVVHDTGSVVFNVGDKYHGGSLLLVPYRFALAALATASVRLVNVVTWVKQNPTPRQFQRRLVSSTEPFFHFAKSGDYYYDSDAFLSDPKPGPSPRRRAKVGERYFQMIERSDLTDAQKSRARIALQEAVQDVYAGKIADFRMKIDGLHSHAFGGQEGGRKTQLERNGFTIIRILGGRIRRDVIETPVESVKGSRHPAIYPVRVVAGFLRLLTREGDLVLDPFVGSGSTAVACKLTGRRYLGFELNPAYCAAARERIAATERDATLF